MKQTLLWISAVFYILLKQSLLTRKSAMKTGLIQRQ